MANNLYLDLELLEGDLRKIIKTGIKQSSVRTEFGQIHLVPQDADLTTDTKFPAIWITVNKNGPYTPAQEDIEVEPFSRFNVTVETYTSGNNKRTKNVKLARYVTSILQERQQLDNFFTRGLRLDQEREITSLIDGVSRRVLRFSGITDNEHNIIFNKEI